MNTPSSNPERVPDDLSPGQIKLLEYLREAGPEGVSFVDMCTNAEEIGYTPEDQEGLVMRGLWPRKGTKIIHPDFVE